MLKVTGFESGYNICHFTADRTEDIESYKDQLPTTAKGGSGDFENLGPISMGSDILVIDPSSVYMLNSEDEWIQL